MQQRFLPLFHQLLSGQNLSPLTGFWLIHSDEPLIIQWLIDACRPIWQTNQQTIKRIELSSHQSWLSVINELDSLSLFGDTNAIIISGNHKPKSDKDSRINILDALEHLAKDTPHHLIWCLPKQDKKSLASKAIKLFDTHGLMIDGNIYDERMRQELLQTQANLLGVHLTPDAWQLLLLHTENNLLTAHQNLWRISLLHHGTINDEQLNACLIDGAEFSVFDLSDCILSGNALKALQILSHLKSTDTAPSIILWALAKDARLIAELHLNKSPETLGIWRNKISLYTQAARRTPAHIAQDWNFDLLEIDKTIKGVQDSNVWHLLQRLTLSICHAAPFNH